MPLVYNLSQLGLSDCQDGDSVIYDASQQKFVRAPAGTATASNGGVSVSNCMTEEIHLNYVTADSSANLLPAFAIIDQVSYRVTEDIKGRKAVGLITLTGVPVLAETFRIDTRTFSFVAARSGAGEVTRGGDAAETCANIILAVTADLASVTAAAGVGTTVRITYNTAGIVGNAITFTEACTNFSMDGAGFLGGTVPGSDVTTFDLGDPVVTDRFVSGVATLTAGSTGVGMNHIGTIAAKQFSAAKLRITADDMCGEGAIRVQVWYRAVTPPTS